MRSDDALTDTPDVPVAPARLFTVETANAALVLVCKIVDEIVACYAEVMRLRAEREALSLEPGNRSRAEELRINSAAALETLNRLHAELVGIGCELKDWTVGCVDFPAVHAGREVRLCWQLGEPRVASWHERDTGFAGRKPIDADFSA